MKAQLVITLNEDNRLHLQGEIPSPEMAKRMLKEAYSLVENNGRDRESGLAFPTADQVRVFGRGR